MGDGVRRSGRVIRGLETDWGQGRFTSRAVSGNNLMLIMLVGIWFWPIGRMSYAWGAVVLMTGWVQTELVMELFMANMEFQALSSAP